MSFVYFILSSRMQRVKIGFSTHPVFRRDQLQTGSADKLKLLGVVRGGSVTEGFLHELLAPWNVRDEWFSYHGPIPSFVALALTAGLSAAVVEIQPLTFGRVVKLREGGVFATKRDYETWLRLQGFSRKAASLLVAGGWAPARNLIRYSFSEFCDFLSSFGIEGRLSRRLAIFGFIAVTKSLSARLVHLSEEQIDCLRLNLFEGAVMALVNSGHVRLRSSV